MMQQHIGDMLDNRYELLELIGTGGMATKLKAAQIVNASGIDMIIANGSDPDILYRITDGEQVGTKFLSR